MKFIENVDWMMTRIPCNKVSVLGQLRSCSSSTCDPQFQGKEAPVVLLNLGDGKIYFQTRHDPKWAENKH